MRSDTLVAPTLIVMQSADAAVQVPTCPILASANRDNVTASLWAERLFAQARPASDDAARFAANLLADFA